MAAIDDPVASANPFTRFNEPVETENPFARFRDEPQSALPSIAVPTPGFMPTIRRTGGQMLTSGARAIDDITGPNQVTGGMRDYGQSVIDRNPAGIRELSDIATSPWLAVKEVAGNVAPQLAVGRAGALAGAAIGGRIGGPGGAAVGGILGGLGPIFAQEYGGIRDEQIEEGHESIPRALGAATVATALERVGPEGRIIFNGLKNPVARSLNQIGAQAGRDILVEGATEGAQNVVEQLGAFKDPLSSENLGETTLSAAMGGIGGGIASGAHSVISSAIAPRKAARDLIAPDLGETDLGRPAPVELLGEGAASSTESAGTAEMGRIIRGTKLPESGPLTRGVNALVEDEAQAANVSYPVHTPVADALVRAAFDSPAGPGNGFDPAEPALGQPNALTFEPGSNRGMGGVEIAQRATFPTREAVDEYLRQARLQQGGERAKAAPVELPDGTFSFLRPNEPGYEEALTESKQTVLQRKRAAAAKVKAEAKPPTVLQQRRAAAAVAREEAAKAAPVTKPLNVLQQRRAAALAAKQNAGAPAADTGALGSAPRVATPPTAPAPTADDTNQPRRVSTEAQAPADQAQPPARGDGAARVAEPAVAGPAAVQTAGVAPDLAGEKIDNEWTTFAPESGTKGVPRADMPQIKAEHRGAMTQFLGARGITHEQAEVPAGDLKPTQAEFSTKKVKAARNFSETDRSILVSSDGHILDGHHQWLAARDAGKTVNVIRLDAPIDKLLAEVKAFPSAGAAEGAGKPVDQATITKLEAASVDGPFGPILRQYRGDAKGAIKALRELEKGEAVAALNHPDIGDIDLVWGEAGTKESNGSGLAKLVKWHPEVLDNLQQILTDMKVTSRTENRVQLASETHKAAVRLEWDGQAKTWLLTAFEKKGAGNSTTTDTAATKRGGDTARPATGTGSSVADSKGPVAAAKPDAPAKSKIEDFGEKLVGARKDYAATLKDALSVDVAVEPLSKSWPEPDYEKLLASGADPKMVAVVRAARDEVRTKPQSSWKLSGWVEQVTRLRAAADAALSGRVAPDAALRPVPGSTPAVYNRTIEDGLRIAGRAALYEAVGHAKSLKGISFAEHHYSLYRGEENVRKWVVEQAAKATAFSNWPREIAVGNTRAEALDAFKAKLGTLDIGRDAKKQPQFVIYRKRGQDGAWIGKKVGREYIDLKKLDDVAQARTFMADNLAALEAALAKYRETPMERRAENQPRVGDDHRNGAPVTPEIFADTFGFRGVQFGNYVEGDRRQSDLNESFDALMDLAAVLGVPPRALSLNGRLGLAFGARGKGGKNAPAAHYEPGTVVINLTKGSGPGSLAHEWWHAADNYFARDFGAGGFATDGVKIDGLRDAMQAQFKEVRSATQALPLRRRAAELDKRRSKPYWNTPIELSARAFESYVIAKLKDQGAANDYLANVVDEQVWNLTEAARAEFFGGEKVETYPYPGQAELPAVRTAFDEFFRTVETREGEGGAVEMFDLGDQPAKLDTAAYGPASQAQRTYAADFQRRIQKRYPAAIFDAVAAPVGSGGRGAAAGGTGRAGEGVSSESLAATAAVGKRLFGHEVVFVKFRGDALFNGAMSDAIPGVVFVNVESERPHMAVLGHELLHQLRASNQGAYSQLSERLAKITKGENRYIAGLAARYAAKGASTENVRFTEELHADIVGDFFMDQQFWEDMARDKPGLFRRVAAAIVKFLDRTLAKMTGPKPFGTDEFVTDIKAARAAVVEAMQQFSSERVAATRRETDGINLSIAGGNPAGRAEGVGERLGSAIKNITVTDVKRRAGNKATDWMGAGLQLLGRRQIVDIYGKMLPLEQYNRLAAQMEADKNEAGAGADVIATAWGKLKDEQQLAELMHEATLARIDPAKDHLAEDDKAAWLALRRKFTALSPEAKKLYERVRDGYTTQQKAVRDAIRERIERSELQGPRKAALMKEMDDRFFEALKGVYFPLARFGSYLIITKDAGGKVASVNRAETKTEADAVRADMLKVFPSSGGFTVSKVLKDKEFVATRDAVGRGFMKDLFEVMDKQDMSEDQRAQIEDALGQLYLSSLPDLSWAKHGIHRKGTPGFSQDARRAFAQNMFHGARYLAKLRYADKLQGELDDMQKAVDGKTEDPNFDSVRAQQVVDEMVKRHASMMNPQSHPLSTALTSLGFIFHLGLSPASAMVNVSQTALVAYPVMAAKWGFNKSGAALLKASQQAAANKNDIQSSLSPDEQRAFDEAVRAGVIDVTMAHDLAGIAQGEDAKVAWKLRPVMKWASFLFHHAERFNRQVTFVAAYRLAREAGQDHEQAHADAVKATYDGHFDYSSSNRPRFMQGNTARVLLLFKQYGQNMVYTLARQAQQAIKAETPAERAQARKALGGLLTMHAMAAGVLGLPMVTTLLAAASMFGGDDDDPWDAKVALQNMLADAFGQKPAEVISHGLSRLTPFDVSGRVGLDKLIFPDVQEGLEGQRLGESAMAAALGPVAGIGINLLKGASDIQQGNFAQGLESMMPAALRGPMKAVRYGREGVVDKTGITVQDEVSPAAIVGQVLGFSPSNVRNAYEGRGAIFERNRALEQRRAALTRQYAMAAMAGDDDGRREALDEIKAWNVKNPSRAITALSLSRSIGSRQRRIAEAVDGVYLPGGKRDAMDAGRFAVTD